MQRADVSWQAAACVAASVNGPHTRNVSYSCTGSRRRRWHYDHPRRRSEPAIVWYDVCLPSSVERQSRASRGRRRLDCGGSCILGSCRIHDDTAAAAKTAAWKPADSRQRGPLRICLVGRRQNHTGRVDWRQWPSIAYIVDVHIYKPVSETDRRRQ